MDKRPKLRQVKLLFIFIFSLILNYQMVAAQILDGKMLPAQLQSAKPLTLPFQKCWSLVNSFSSAIASDNISKFFITYSDGKVRLFDSYTHHKQWETELGGEIKTVIFNNESAYVTSKSLADTSDSTKNVNDVGSKKSSEENNKLDNREHILVRSLDILTGIVRWEADLPSAEEDGEIFLHAVGAKLIIVTRKGNIYSLEKESGHIAWAYSLKTEISSNPHFGKEKVILGTSDSRIVFVELPALKIFSTLDISVPTSLIIEDTSENRLIWANRRGQVISVSNYTGKVNINEKKAEKKADWKYRNGSEISHITLTKKGILVSSLDNFMYLISKDKGKLIWKKRFYSRILFEPLVVDGYAIVSTYANPVASIIELNGGKTVNSINLSNENFFTGSPVKIENNFIFPTLEGLAAFSPVECSKR